MTKDNSSSTVEVIKVYDDNHHVPFSSTNYTGKSYAYYRVYNKNYHGVKEEYIINRGNITLTYIDGKEVLEPIATDKVSEDLKQKIALARVCGSG